MFVRQVTWLNRRDDTYSFEPLPGYLVAVEDAFRVRDTHFPYSDIVEKIEAGKNLQIPLIGITRPIGVDGVSYGVESPGVFRIEWWSDGPTEWQTVTDWAETMRSYLIR